MYYGTTTLATNFTEKEMRHWKIRLIKAILFFIPRANPDTEKLYPWVRAWALELSDEGWPQREIGIDSGGVPLFGAPDSRNTGFWTDIGAKQFKRSELGELTGSEFERLWGLLSGESDD